MCNKLVTVKIPVERREPYATGNGRLKYRAVGGSELIDVNLRCGHGMTDADRADGFSPVDCFGRPILCSEHNS